MSLVFHRQSAPCLLCGSAKISRSRLIKGYTIVDCARCGLRYVQDRVREDEIMRYYQHDYFLPGDDPTNGYEDYFLIRKEREKTFRLYLKKALGHVARFEEVLDIGCGAGYFLNAAKPYFHHLTGVDVSPDALARADSSFNLVCSDFHAGLFPAGHADLIMLCDVIEHVYHPKDFLGEVRKVLHPQGIACIITPNRSSLLARLTGKRYVSYKLPEHVSYFDPRTLAMALGEAGLEMITWHTCGQYATIDYVGRRVSSLLFGKREALPIPRFLGERTFHVNTGSMLVLARHIRP